MPKGGILRDGIVDRRQHVARVPGPLLVEHLEDDEVRLLRRALILLTGLVAGAANQPGDVRAVPVLIAGAGGLHRLGGGLGEVEKRQDPVLRQVLRRLEPGIDQRHADPLALPLGAAGDHAATDVEPQGLPEHVPGDRLGGRVHDRVDRHPPDARVGGERRDVGRRQRGGQAADGGVQLMNLSSLGGEPGGHRVGGAPCRPQDDPHRRGRVGLERLLQRHVQLLVPDVGDGVPGTRRLHRGWVVNAGRRRRLGRHRPQCVQGRRRRLRCRHEVRRVPVGLDCDRPLAPAEPAVAVAVPAVRGARSPASASRTGAVQARSSWTSTSAVAAPAPWRPWVVSV